MHSPPPAPQPSSPTASQSLANTPAGTELTLEELLGTPGNSAKLPQPRRRVSFQSAGRSAEINRRPVLALVLFFLTCATTYLAGVSNWSQAMIGAYPSLWNMAVDPPRVKVGLEYMSAMMAILLAHEMGHFLMTVRHQIMATYPIFIPFPSLFTGTMGAVISMDNSRANRKQLFDIGIAGPLAGLAVILPVLYYGITTAHVRNYLAVGNQGFAGHPWLYELLVDWLRPEVLPHQELVPNPWLMAGWIGCLITGLNMFPLSQLDGGHVVYCLFGKFGNQIARLTLIFCMAMIILTNNYLWTVMILIVTAVLGVNHPPTTDDTVPLGWFRVVLGVLSLSIPIFCFIPRPFAI
ncbi:MAG: site-2 protease family protein [Pirellulales bacterium]|nr:site-2 protease family protein [Pirellulales bacterium]